MTKNKGRFLIFLTLCFSVLLSIFSVVVLIKSVQWVSATNIIISEFMSEIEDIENDNTHYKFRIYEDNIYAVAKTVQCLYLVEHFPEGKNTIVSSVDTKNEWENISVLMSDIFTSISENPFSNLSEEETASIKKRFEKISELEYSNLSKDRRKSILEDLTLIIGRLSEGRAPIEIEVHIEGYEELRS